MTTLKYRPEIDGLRAIAVSAVVLYHAGFGLRAGSVGVDIFFVISGYLITSLLHAEELSTGSIDLFAFYARRVRRILPALVTVVLAVVAASTFLLSPFGEIRQAALSGSAGLLFVANLFFQFTTGGYFDTGSERMPLMHLWSLGVEEQFYLIWPIGMLLWRRWRPESLGMAIAVCGVLSFALSEALLVNMPNVAFYEMPARFWELAVGGWIAVQPRHESARGGVLAAVGLLVVIASTVLPIAHFPGIGAAPAVLGAGLLIAAVHVTDRLGAAGALLRSRPMVFVGLISYSLYLWHWPLLAYARAVHAGEVSPLVRAGLCVASGVLAWMSYRFVERPFRRPSPDITSRKVVAVGVLVSVVLAAAIYSYGNLMNVPPPPQDLASRTERDQPENKIACHFRGDEAVDAIPKPGCYTDSRWPARVAIWGDSHALAMEPFAQAIAERDHYSMLLYSRDACAPVLGVDNGKRHLEAERCREFNARIADRVDGLDTLVMTANWLQDPDFESKLDATIGRVSPHVRRIVLIGQTPRMRDEAPHCMRTNNLAACAIPRSEFEEKEAGMRVFLQSMAAKYPNVEYVDAEDFFCDRTSCPAVKDGIGLYWDSNHVASSAAWAFVRQYLARHPIGKPGSPGGS